MRFASLVAVLRLVLITASFFLTIASAWAAGPSFDCAKAKAPDEIVICGDEQLAQLDRLAALAYDEARHASGRSSARAAARDGLAARSHCGADRDCIMSVQVATIIKFQQLGATVTLPDWAMSATMDGSNAGDGGALPTEIGQCANTTIVEITSRFQADINADPDDGSAVTFENGGAPGLLREGAAAHPLARRRPGADVPRRNSAGLPAGRRPRPHLHDDEPQNAGIVDAIRLAAFLRRGVSDGVASCGAVILTFSQSPRDRAMPRA